MRAVMYIAGVDPDEVIRRLHYMPIPPDDDADDAVKAEWDALKRGAQLVCEEVWDRIIEPRTDDDEGEIDDE